MADAGLFLYRCPRVPGWLAVELMWTPTTLPDGRTVGYGFGWALFDFRGAPVRAHNGQVAGFVADFWRLPEQETASSCS